jgi:RNA polymerase sigma-70 factor (ECF subfamily)
LQDESRDLGFLVYRLRQKDREALSYLYEHYAPALYGLMLRIVGKREVADELLQDAFLKFWDNIEQYDASKGRLFTWMFNIARNLAVDFVRSKEGRQAGRTHRINELINEVENEKVDRQKEDSIGVNELLKKLPEQEQNIIQLLYLKGYSQSEIAREYDIPLGTVKTRTRSAMKNLRSLLNIK